MRVRARHRAHRDPRSPRAGDRFAGVDLLRGLAIAMMVSYHLCYDLAYLRLVPWTPDDMLTELGWIGWRDLIVISFLTLVGFSRALSTVFKPSASDFWKRWAQIAGAAALVSLASRGFAGERWIYFGILHFIAVAVLLCRLILFRVRSAPWIAALGVAAIVAGLLFASAALDPPPFNVLGFVAHKPRTDDYVPLFPWIGVVLIGLAAGLLWKAHDFEPIAPLSRLRAAAPAPLRKGLARAGRWSLTIYLVHQPILIGVLTLVAGLIRPRPGL
ncbi:MAG TPA: heparan-alpha-glucosaminide N-acetyltransferase [Steroidobacteraceae bacterium]|jgi:uncharacterized membrane protein|nr:heparan-alpha-glucosaminide N-acetyltransferase [Steroidobacteraceae bacterium]